MKQTVTIAIGRNVGSQPIGDLTWSGFCSAIRNDLFRLQRDYVNVKVTLISETAGFDYTGEPCAVFVATVDGGRREPRAALSALRAHLALRALHYQQDAIALTVGQTTFV